jgi:hypothetical protein
MASILNLIRRFVGDRRKRKRRRADLLLTVSVVTKNTSTSVSRQTATALDGLTHDLSSTYLAINVPAIRLGDRYLTAPDSRLEIVLDLPKGKVDFQGTAIRYEKQAGNSSGKGYLVAVDIKRMSESNRALYNDYLRTLS